MVVVLAVRNVVNAVKETLHSFAPVFVLLFYTIAGALIFMLIEGPNEQYELETLKRERAELLEATAFKLNNIRGMNSLQAYNHTVKTLDRYREQLGVAAVNTSNARWDIWGSIFYTLCVYTTIGYGDIVPVTTTGRVLTILYAIVGIPLALISLISLGKLLAKFLKFCWSIFTRTTRVVSKDLEKHVKKLGPEETEEEEEVEALLHFPVFFLLLITVAYVFACAGIFLLWEEQWDYGNSLYFTMTSFTTIGFGDILPSKREYMIIVGILLLIGLALVSTLLSIIQQQIEALAAGMKSTIDRNYVEALEANEVDEEPQSVVEKAEKLAANGDATSPDETRQKLMPAERRKADERTMDAMVARMPTRSRMLFHMIPASSRKQLRKYAENRARLVSRASQTDDYLIQALLDRCGSSDDVTQLVLEDVPSLPTNKSARGIAQLDYIALTPD